MNQNNNTNLSELLIALHHGSNVVSPDEFRGYALELVRSVIPFDSAVWGKHSRMGGELVASEMHLHGQPAEMRQSWESVCHYDVGLTEALAALPWMTVNFDYSRTTQPLAPELHLHIRSFGLMHCLCTTGYDPISHAPHHIMLSRNDSARPYTEEDRLLKQYLMPHLEAACDHNHRLLPQSKSAKPRESERRQANALIDSQGVLVATEPRFLKLLKAEFPDWHGPLLPQPLLKTFIEQNCDRHVGNTIALTANRRSSMWLLWARTKQPIDDFSDRTMRLAMHFAEGLNHKEIGQLMNISPATVRNHITVIYKKLRINNKTQLAHLLSGVRQPRMRE